MDTDPTGYPPQGQSENPPANQQKRGRDIIVFGVLILIGAVVVATLIMKT